MFYLLPEYTVDRSFLKCDIVLYTPSSVNLVEGKSIQFFLDLPRKGSAFSWKNSYFG